MSLNLHRLCSMSTGHCPVIKNELTASFKNIIGLTNVSEIGICYSIIEFQSFSFRFGWHSFQGFCHIPDLMRLIEL